MKQLSRFLACLTLAASLLCGTSLPAHADVGNIDWGDYGGGYSGGYDGGYGGGYDGGYVFIGDTGSLGSTSVVTIVAVIVVVLVICYIRSKTVSGRQTTSAQPMRTLRQSAENTITAADEQAVIEKIRALDPDFAAEQFKTYAGDVIVRVQEAWEARDWSVIRPFESDKLFALHQRQLNEFIDQKKTNHMDQQYIQRVSLAAFTEDGANEVLTVRVDMSLCDYTTDDATGQIISGVKTLKLLRAYRLEFIRTAGTKTDTDQSCRAANCPSCGAPLELGASGKCEYCGCVVTSGRYGWVLNAYNPW